MNNLLIKIIVIFSFLLSFANAETLKKFEISGNKRISDQTIIIFSEIKINEEITKTKLDEVIKRFHLSKLQFTFYKFNQRLFFNPNNL